MKQSISRENFIFTIGYEGNKAVVDGNLKKRFRSLSVVELAEKGLYKQALCAAIYDFRNKRDAVELEQVLNIYNKGKKAPLNSVEELKRTFGVFEVPEVIGNVITI